ASDQRPVGLQDRDVALAEDRHVEAAVSAEGHPIRAFVDIGSVWCNDVGDEFPSRGDLPIFPREAEEVAGDRLVDVEAVVGTEDEAVREAKTPVEARGLPRPQVDA